MLKADFFLLRVQQFSMCYGLWTTSDRMAAPCAFHCSQIQRRTDADWILLQEKTTAIKKKKRKRQTDSKKKKKKESIWSQGLVPKTHPCCKMQPSPTLTLISHTAWIQLAVKNIFLKDFITCRNKTPLEATRLSQWSCLSQSSIYLKHLWASSLITKESC